MLAEFAAFLKKAGHLEEVAADNLRRWRQLDLPLTRLFGEVPDAELMPRFRASLETFCDDLIAGRRSWRLREVLKLWEEDRLPGVPRDRIEPSDLVLANAAQREALWAFIMPIAILGSIFVGIVTATEGAGIAVVAAIVVGGFIYHDLDFRELRKACIDGGVQTAVVMLLVASSALIGTWSEGFSAERNSLSIATLFKRSVA